MELLDQLKAAQQRVNQLQASKVDMNAPEAKRAVNRLITLIRGATPEDLRAFDAWKQQARAHPD